LELAEPWIQKFLERWEDMELPASRVWNVNLPKGEPRGFRLTGQDRRNYHDSVEKRLDPRGIPYYWIGGSLPTYERSAGSDAAAALDGWISVTPHRLDLACPELLARAKAFESTFNLEG
jgi:5'-nucleotidase